jgi:hypothetical protein
MRSLRPADDLLKRGMFRDGRGNWTLAASELMNVESRSSHGQMISWKDAASPKLGLVVEHMDADDPLWQNFGHAGALDHRLVAGLPALVNVTASAAP